MNDKFKKKEKQHCYDNELLTTIDEKTYMSLTEKQKKQYKKFKGEAFGETLYSYNPIESLTNTEATRFTGYLIGHKLLIIKRCAVIIAVILILSALATLIFGGVSINKIIEALPTYTLSK
ncbi:MAG: hypothetical protein Q8873_08305 [Bacillota bacterium]|nr:hypothetical protein [Bacillota bacterium]